MNKVLFLLLIVLFISGCDKEIGGESSFVCNEPYIQVGEDCCLDDNGNSICDKDEEFDELEVGKEVELPEEKEEEPEIEEVEKEEPETLEKEKIISMKEGDIVVFNGDTIKLLDIDLSTGDLEFIVDVMGVERSLYSTKKPEIVNGVKISALSVDKLKQILEVKLELFELGANEYLVSTNKNVVVNGREIKLRNVQSDDYILIDIVGGTLKTDIREGYTETVDGLNIGNVKAFFRDSLNERYAIINATKV